MEQRNDGLKRRRTRCLTSIAAGRHRPQSDESGNRRDLPSATSASVLNSGFGVQQPEPHDRSGLVSLSEKSQFYISPPDAAITLAFTNARGAAAAYYAHIFGQEVNSAFISSSDIHGANFSWKTLSRSSSLLVALFFFFTSLAMTTWDLNFRAFLQNVNSRRSRADIPQLR